MMEVFSFELLDFTFEVEQTSRGWQINAKSCGRNHNSVSATIFPHFLNPSLLAQGVLFALQNLGIESVAVHSKIYNFIKLHL